jgi:hypothetical protein
VTAYEWVPVFTTTAVVAERYCEHLAAQARR